MTQTPIQSQIDAKGLAAATMAVAYDDPYCADAEVSATLAIRAYIASQEAAAPSEEPVAWRWKHRGTPSYRYEYAGERPTGESLHLFDVQPLYASPAVAPVAVSVKELEWSGPNTLADGQIVWSAIAEGMEFTYSIWTAGVGYEERFFCAKVLPQLFDSLDEAKAAVQFNYDERIRSAIVTTNPKCCTICGSTERCEACAEVNEIEAGIEGISAIQSHVGHSLANDTWFARFYPFASEADAKAFNARILSSIIPATKGGETVEQIAGSMRQTTLDAICDVPAPLATFTISIFEDRSTLHVNAASGTTPNELLAKAKATLDGEAADLAKCPFHLPSEIDPIAFEAARNSFVMAEHRRGNITRKVLTAYIAALSQGIDTEVKP